MHQGCRYFVWPKHNAEFWKEKIIGNAVRDQNNKEKLEDLGWQVLVVWECQLKESSEQTLSKLANEIKRNMLC